MERVKSVSTDIKRMDTTANRNEREAHNEENGPRRVEEGEGEGEERKEEPGGQGYNITTTEVDEAHPARSVCKNWYNLVPELITPSLSRAGLSSLSRGSGTDS
jgi:hypothetical protein